MVGRKPHQPTKEARRQVCEMAGMGLPQDQICSLIGVSIATLHKHYKEELVSGAAKANFQVAKSLFRLATGENPNPASAMFWAKTRMKWRETDSEQKDSEITVTLKNATPDHSATLGKGIAKRSKE